MRYCTREEKGKYNLLVYVYYIDPLCLRTPAPHKTKVVRFWYLEVRGDLLLRFIRASKKEKLIQIGVRARLKKESAFEKRIGIALLV
ncbi:hypothetical protein NEUTE2DRAFT_73925 [Neurospora tetrasperma FGSC 2509]|nr:hypothetical protein NEUTE2DRAFT_73925 [Neurospora tetrasperma FGSC 2509]